ncbi:lipase family protein [Corynebacterium pacaense]|uniref:lipase family protein n=1 Tax=Corynebacterium pacaense TaxID=1816684 RepID=UPI0009B9DC1B|nr:lipase family protein [Corynebacterium pacaense]
MKIPWIRLSTSVLAVLIGLFLLPRPLTALLVLLAVLPFAVPLAWYLRRRPDTALPLGIGAVVLAGAISAAAVINARPLVTALPVILPIGLGIGSIALLGYAIRRRLVLPALGAGACILAAWSLWWWPDAALLLIAYTLPLTLILGGVLRLLPEWRPRGRRIAVSLVTVLALLLSGTAAVATTYARASVAAADPFYDWAGTIPEPGTLLRIDAYTGTTPDSALPQRILYATTRADGSPAVASAVVALPAADRRTSTVLAWQHGTTGVSQFCAPSMTPTALTELAIPGIDTAISRGWTVVATDYPGQGTTGRYPYLIGEGEGRATLDAVRAARGLDGVGRSGDTMLWGHSQGGHATLFVDQIAADYAPELHITGVAALSAAADPLLLAERITASGASALGSVISSYVLVPYSEEYPDVALADYVHPAGLAFIRAYAQRCVTEKSMVLSVLTAAALGGRAPLLDIDLDDSAAAEHLRGNTASGAGTAPLFLGQGIDDEVVPIAGQAEMAQRARLSGRPVTERSYPGRSHMGVIAEDSPLIPDLFEWEASISG